MLKNTSTIKSRGLRSENESRVITNAVTKNYLKPTTASLKRNRFALADVTTKVNSRSRQTSTITKQNSIKKTIDSTALFSYKTTYVDKKNVSSDINKGDTLSLRRKEIEYQEKQSDSNIPLKRNTIYKDENTEDVIHGNVSYQDDDIYVYENKFEVEQEIIEPLLPYFDENIEKTLDEAVIQYFSPTPDFNDEDTYDPVMAVEYNIDIFTYIRELEVRYSPKSNYIDLQPQLKWHHRTELLDWLIQVHERFQLLPETLYLAVNIMDRFLSRKIATLNRFQLVGITALFIACKYEEIHCPTLNDIIYILDNEYTREDILQAESFMLNTLNFEISWPGPMSFLRRISKADSYEYSIRTLSKYFLETTLLDPRLISSPPSWLAAGAYFLSRIILKDDQWSLKHCYYSGYTREQLLPLVLVICDNCKEGKIKHHTIWKKYSDIKYHKSREIFDQWVDSMIE